LPARNAGHCRHGAPPLALFRDHAVILEGMQAQYDLEMAADRIGKEINLIEPRRAA